MYELANSKLEIFTILCRVFTHLPLAKNGGAVAGIEGGTACYPNSRWFRAGLIFRP
jgi:hypothetical protein